MYDRTVRLSSWRGEEELLVREEGKEEELMSSRQMYEKGVSRMVLLCIS